MRAVNLLPEELRPRRASGGSKGSSYVLLGVLGVLLLMAVGYALTTNSINSKTTDIAAAEQETAEAEARAAELAPYEEFAQIKATRIASVTQVASQRFDWERTMREVALVLPAGTSLVELNAATAGAAEGASGSAPAPPTDPAATGGGGPTLQVKGCAEHHSDVATLMVRLRKLYRAADVTLTESVSQSVDSGTAGATAGAVSSDVAAGSAGCPSDTYQFDMNVAFTALDLGEKEKLQAPARLGGGA